ncbi:flagellar hook-basal body complex protein FliE [Planomicrobium okeanokoites]|uniref:flagellar hook-basal body complex protein FliE n=1 Tax=Planomicrobium okeanokoites TaxID=244 RepID=UPI003567B622
MNPINQIQTPFIQGLTNPNAKPENKVEGFGEIFKQAIQNVNQTQKASDKLTSDLATGQVENIHEVMIASEKASLSLELTMQVRNKVVEAYQEVMRMQV